MTPIDEGTDTQGAAHGLAYMRASSELTAPGAARGVVAECPGDRTTTGGGAVVQGTSGVPFDDSGPIAGFSKRQSWGATFTNESGGVQQLHAYAVCGKLDGRALRQETIEDASALQEVKLRARCPAGTNVTGGGVEFSGDSSQSRGLAPFDSGGDSDARPDDGWKVTAYPDQVSTITATAVCAPGAFAYRTDTIGPFPSDTLAIPQPTCQEDESTTGGGVTVSGSSPGASITHSSPQDGVDPDQVPDDRWDSGVEIPQGETATGIAICKK
ncbi:MAG: hypothetical protein ACR2G3_00395 [Solirubrobacterales bacterium]